MFLRSFCESIKIIYYPMTNIFFILSFFIIAICIANRLDFNATLKTTLIILPIVLISVIFLFLTNLGQFTPQRMFPIFGEGIYNTFVLGLVNLYSFAGIEYIYFLPPFLKKPENMKKILLISIGISALYLLLSVATLLFIFAFFVSTNEITPLYNATRYIEFGNFFQRLESIFLLFWILVFACYLSIVIKFSMEIFKKLTNISTKKPLIDVFGLLILGISLIPKNYAISQKFERSIYNLAYVLAIAIDTSTDNKLEVSFQFSTSLSPESGSNNKPSTIINTVTASSLSNATNLINGYLGKQINMSHCKVIIFSEELASQGISDEIYTLIMILK